MVLTGVKMREGGQVLMKRIDGLLGMIVLYGTYLIMQNNADNWKEALHSIKVVQGGNCLGITLYPSEPEALKALGPLTIPGQHVNGRWVVCINPPGGWFGFYSDIPELDDYQ